MIRRTLATVAATAVMIVAFEMPAHASETADTAKASTTVSQNR